jgi:hypothetical protein
VDRHKRCLLQVLFVIEVVPHLAFIFITGADGLGLLVGPLDGGEGEGCEG